MCRHGRIGGELPLSAVPPEAFGWSGCFDDSELTDSELEDRRNYLEAISKRKFREISRKRQQGVLKKSKRLL